MKISTKNLYLATLMQIKKEEYNPITLDSITYFYDEERYIFCKKTRKEETYIDVFTKTPILKIGTPNLQPGDWCIRKLHPIITDYKYIPTKILSEALKELNPIIFKQPKIIKNSKKEKPKSKVIKLIPRHNNNK